MAHILVVDDDPVLLDLLAKLLERSGHTVRQARDGLEGLKIVAGQKFDLIITDVMMPDLDGYELTQKLRAQPNARDALILIQTSSLQGPDKKLAQAAGADAYILKTVNVTRLTRTIEEMLAKGRPAAV